MPGSGCPINAAALCECTGEQQERKVSLGKEMVTILDLGGSFGSIFEGKCDVQSHSREPGTISQTSDFHPFTFGHIHVTLFQIKWKFQIIT